MTFCMYFQKQATLKILIIFKFFSAITQLTSRHIDSVVGCQRCQIRVEYNYRQNILA